MDGFFLRRKNLIIISGVILISLLMSLSSQKGGENLTFAERAAITVLGPFQRAVDWGNNSLSGTWSDYIYLVDLKEKNNLLEKQVDRLAFENNAMVEQIKRMRRVEKMIAEPLAVGYDFEVAQVIARDTSNRVRILILNKGTDDGVTEGMPVITHRGLVGKVVRTAAFVSKLLLITDRRSGIDAIVQESREGLVVAGTGGPALEVKYLSVNADATKGDRVISSGLGGAYPKGLLIGVLGEIKKRRDSLFLESTLVPTADMTQLEEVLILKVEMESPRKLMEALPDNRGELAK